MGKILVLLLLFGFLPGFAQETPNLKKPKSGGAPDIYEAPPSLDSNGPEAEDHPEPAPEPAPSAPKSGKSPYENPETLKEPEDEKNADRGDDSAFKWKETSPCRILARSDLAATYDALSAAADLPGGEEYELWCTGPLLVPAGDLIELGHATWQPYLFVNEYHGFYGDDWHASSYPLFSNVSAQGLIRVGIFPYGEFDFTPILNYNHTSGASKWIFGDMPVNLDILLSEDETWLHPNLKFRVSGVLPIGKYEKLKASKLETDLSGIGTWLPGVGLIYYHEEHIYKHHFLTLTGFVTYMYGTPVNVKGINAYGGDPTTEGKVRPGNLWQGILSFEYSLTQNWVLALDMIYNHLSRSKFNGSTVEPMDNPSMEQFSLAPAVEYNFSKNFGINAGAWFTVAGRNTDQFASAVMSIYIVK